MGHSNISVFVPHIGCPHMCAFCNQRTITGTEKIPHADDVKRICTQAMNEVKDVSQTEIAFFGGIYALTSLCSAGVYRQRQIQGYQDIH